MIAARNAEIATTVTSDLLWTSIIARKTEADAKFYYSVKTTGVYCRPSCAARLARPENIQFHQTRRDAERAGFRPCKRCRPDQPWLVEQHAATITKICRRIEQSDETPLLGKLVAEAGMSVFHFHRVFKVVTGLRRAAMAKRIGPNECAQSLARARP